MESKVASFKSRLASTGKGLLNERAANIAEMTKLEATNCLSAYKTKVLRLKNQLESHADLAVESTHSLRPGSKDFDPKAWVDMEIDMRKQLRVAKIEYNEALKWFNDMFPADEEAESDLTVEEED